MFRFILLVFCLSSDAYSSQKHQYNSFTKPLSKVYLAQIKNKYIQNLSTLSQINTIYKKNNHEDFRRSHIKNFNNSYHSNKNYEILPHKSISNHQQRQYSVLEIQQMKQKVNNFLNNSPTNKKQLIQNQRQIIGKLERIKQKTGSQMVNRQQFKQIKDYIQLAQFMHVKACGNGCKHLERFYSLIKDLKFGGRKQLKISTYLIDNISKT